MARSGGASRSAARASHEGARTRERSLAPISTVFRPAFAPSPNPNPEILLKNLNFLQFSFQSISLPNLPYPNPSKQDMEAPDQDRRHGEDHRCLLEGWPSLLRPLFIEEAERSLHDAIMIVRRARKNSTVVAGGGAIDMEVSQYLRQHAREIAGKSQLFINSYAKAIEVYITDLTQLFTWTCSTCTDMTTFARGVRGALWYMYSNRRRSVGFHTA